jgi:hypothetical protein
MKSGVFHNEHGLTFVEMAISAALVSVFALAALYWFALLSHEAAFHAEGLAIENKMLQVRAAFGDDDILCTKILKNQPLTSTSGATLNSLQFYDRDPANNTPLKEVLRLNQPIDSKTAVITTRLQLVPVSAINANTIVAHLEMTFAKDGKKFLVNRKLALQALVQGGRIRSCSTSMSSTITMSSRVCEILDDGYYHYEPVSDRCVENSNIQYFPGIDTTKAVCPPGWRPAASKLNPDPGKVACHSDAPNSSTLPSRTYLSGFVDDTKGLGFVGTLDFDTGICTYIYAASVNPNLYKTKIRCVKVSGASP